MFTMALGTAEATTGEDGDEGSKEKGDSKAAVILDRSADDRWRLPGGRAVKSGDAIVGSEKLYNC